MARLPTNEKIKKGLNKERDCVKAIIEKFKMENWKSTIGKELILGSQGKPFPEGGLSMKHMARNRYENFKTKLTFQKMEDPCYSQNLFKWIA